MSTLRDRTHCTTTTGNEKKKSHSPCLNGGIAGCSWASKLLLRSRPKEKRGFAF
ncbi:uncharacterized protein BO72DRAFT_453172 [Aspergillus fijiensis CBS 313.89]|uniref:Uncharacterized protein n=1 Tax=Aspergillus fijiensis CBS 313.89 TaxID=1448319 RepID=A0A8G1VTD5_9EURO|nr:uncharacterized protein BO72DRAFT_453172 [Aspergillus fijiensis CBS 313.89]RAK71972.1 hypothetical protein BO72DRAFT_453172 [Aspergillus fijiensis CBS 313.89]